MKSVKVYETFVNLLSRFWGHMIRILERYRRVFGRAMIRFECMIIARNYDGEIV